MVSKFSEVSVHSFWNKLSLILKYEFLFSVVLSNSPTHQGKWHTKVSMCDPTHPKPFLLHAKCSPTGSVGVSTSIRCLPIIGIALATHLCCSKGPVLLINPSVLLFSTSIETSKNMQYLYLLTQKVWASFNHRTDRTTSFFRLMWWLYNVGRHATEWRCYFIHQPLH